MNTTDQIVFILGAGCSHHIGLPLLCNFFEKAEALKNGNEYGQHPPPGYTQALERVNEYRRALKKQSFEIDIHNIESIYSEALKGSGEFSDILSDLNKVLLGVLDMGGCTLHYHDKSYQPDNIYDTFVNNINSYKGKASIISFNWDCYLDYALFYNVQSPNYFSFSSTETNFFKIHGSLNFGKCISCGHAPQIIQPNSNIGFRPGVERRKDVKFDLRMVSEVLPQTKCEKCTTGQLEPIIIPPLLDKQFEDIFKSLLGEAKKALETANKLFFIGYSFPDSDQYFIDFMDRALIENVHLRTINIVNPDAISLKDRYHRNLKCEKHHLHLEAIPATFETFVSQMMGNI